MAMVEKKMCYAHASKLVPVIIIVKVKCTYSFGFKNIFYMYLYNVERLLDLKCSLLFKHFIIVFLEVDLASFRFHRLTTEGRLVKPFSSLRSLEFPSVHCKPLNLIPC